MMFVPKGSPGGCTVYSRHTVLFYNQRLWEYIEEETVKMALITKIRFKRGERPTVCQRKADC
jgi:hypothetical protein